MITKIITFIKHSIKDLIKFTIDVIGEFIFKHANEIQMLMGGYYFYQHPPASNYQYIAVACYFSINTIVVLKKGNIELKPLVELFKSQNENQKPE